ncbi:hypothetical protein [Paenibacillus sp. sgz5001063]|uniref:hypothetical protein n=1 Tax=Paenibacillus sp. sgz5001063 TaxID=3242474 RepID=UPI0036D24C11
MAWSWVRMLVVPLSLGSMVLGKNEKKNSCSKMAESDWNLHSDYFELMVLNERLKKELDDLTV